LVIYLGGGKTEEVEVQQLHARNIPVFPTPERGMKAFSKLLYYYRNIEPSQEETLSEDQRIRNKENFVQITYQKRSF
jgi:acyl-CoA synthetase (NDP forming)